MSLSRQVSLASGTIKKIKKSRAVIPSNQAGSQQQPSGIAGIISRQSTKIKGSISTVRTSSCRTCG